MRVLISVDMEGVTGMTDPEDVLRDGDDYAQGRRLMTSDANAAVAGAFDAGATEVIVNDSHWEARNLLLEELDERAIVIKGFHKPLVMLEGLDGDTAAAVFIGYHSMKGTEFGVLNESFIGKEVHNVFLDDEPIGEICLNALIAGQFGVPVAFVSGDDKACEEARALLGDGLETFAVKTGIDKFAARCLSPAASGKGIREGVARALGNLDALTPYKLERPARFGIEWNSTTIATICSFIPTVEKRGSRITEFTTDDPVHALKVMFVEFVAALEIARGSRVYA